MTENLTVAFVGDQGVQRIVGHTWWYQGEWIHDVDPFPSGPAESAVANMVHSWEPDEVMILGDFNYDAGVSTLMDDNVGKDYNNYMYPYPSPFYVNVDEELIANPKFEPEDFQKTGKTEWTVTDPYIVYDYPNGYPNPVTGDVGGSSDGMNHLWMTIGNHDWVKPTYENNRDNNDDYRGLGGFTRGEPEPFKNPPDAAVNYFAWMRDPSLANVPSLEIGNFDTDGDLGNYYTFTSGETSDGRPLVRIISLDANRIVQSADNGKISNYDPTIPIEEQDIELTNLNDPANANNGLEQFIWLDEVLSNDEAEWTILTGHHPAYASSKDGRTYPDNYGSIAPLIKLMGEAGGYDSFDAYINGHAHYYERIMESEFDPEGVGLGIPFITTGNGGKGLNAIRSLDILDPLYSGYYFDEGEQLQEDLESGVLPDTEPIRVSRYALMNPNSNQALAVFSNENVEEIEDEAAFIDGVAGLDVSEYTGPYGYGAVKLTVNEEFMYFEHEPAKVYDTAFVSGLLSAGVQEEEIDTWSPTSPAKIELFAEGPDDRESDEFKNYVTDGTEGIVGFNILDSGQGYPVEEDPLILTMQLPGGSSLESGAVLELVFSEGQLNDVTILEEGDGYWETKFNILGDQNVGNLVLTLDVDLTKTLYPEASDTTHTDFFISTHTTIEATSVNTGEFGSVQFSVQPSSAEAVEVLQQPAPIGLEDFITIYPDQGTVSASDAAGNSLGEVTLDGSSEYLLNFVQEPVGDVTLEFSGDSEDAYVVRFLESQTTLSVSEGEIIEGTDGDDRLVGGQGNDTIAGLLGNDEIEGLGGDDILRGDANSRSPGGSEGGNDTINGGSGDDQIGGKGGSDELYGDEGNDEIWGDDGDDLLRGGLGDDILTGDDFSGGSGADTFILAVGEGTDTITDFEIGIDVIGLEGLTFADLSLSGNAIAVDDETLAIVEGVIELMESDFVSLD
ncbi:MAG: hypothetical protein AAFO04_24815 [Cyanobacteria bacterium J06592_8]